jgi:primary-amine oxidase
MSDLRDRLKPVVIDQPKGVNFTLDGNMVHWQNWSFHVRFDKRVGVIISDVKYKDKDEIRSVMYQSFISELFVPYMDPTQEWFFKSFYDVGEFQIGTDVPDDAVVFHPLVPDDRGRVFRYNNAYAIFERKLLGFGTILSAA